MTTQKFSPKLNIEAVRLVMARSVAVVQAAHDLEVVESVLRRWMRELTVAPAAAFPGNGQMRSDLAEIASLKKEVARQRAKRDIPRKAAAFLERESAWSSPTSPETATSGPSAGCAMCWRTNTMPSGRQRGHLLDEPGRQCLGDFSDGVLLFLTKDPTEGP